MIKKLLCLFIIGFILSICQQDLVDAHAKPMLQSESAILINAKTGEVLFEKNSAAHMYPASITKIITGIIAIEEGNLDDIVTVSENARNVIGTRVYLLEGEEVPLKRLVQGLLISSGNDAGTAIAEHLDGSEEAFSERMNRFVREQIGVYNTTFTNPHGLFHRDHKTTAADMAKITQYAMKNGKFREIVGTNEMEWIGEGWETTIYNHHQLIRQYEGVTGVKNGFVSLAGFTLVTSAEQGDMELIAVTLKAYTSEGSYTDTSNLLDYGFENYTTNVIPKGTIYEDELGKIYRLTEPVKFTTKKDEEFAKEFTDGGILKVYDINENKILKETIEPGELTKRKNKVGVSLLAQEPMPKSNFHKYIYISILLAIVSVVVYFKKRK
ncbi:D-alanyl-D-alanine carboxypeptidase family protein [Anaerobacillus arseniciselenatis]|nr:D-alanyl-D-alanine carboxypeptidase family protein [Anaerobacillus arseniciselenatis]